MLSHLRWLRRSEILLLVVASAAALIGAIETQQFAAALKGSWMAFAGLFAWGIAAEQIKNAFTKVGSEMKK